MNFGGFFDSTSAGGGGGSRILTDMPYTTVAAAAAVPGGAMAQPRLFSPPLSKSIFSSPGLSLALEQPEMEKRGEAAMKAGENFEGHINRRSREEERESRSGSDNVEGISGDDQDAAEKPPRKKRYHRHTPQQIQELEAMFKECPHPDEKQRLELSKRLCLETRQVKFWFQNRRTQMKTQLERHENALLRQENDKLRAENLSIREAMRNPICSNCGGSAAVIGDLSFEEEHLRVENARLKDELDRVCALAGKFLGRPIPAISGDILPNSELGLGVGTNHGGFGGLPLSPDFGISSTAGICLPVMPPPQPPPVVHGVDRRSVLLELALTAMDELVKLAHSDEPLWLKCLDGGDKEILNHEEYMRSFTPCTAPKPAGFVSKASRTAGTVIINSLALVETLMDSNRWSEVFPCIVARASTTDVISGGMAGTRNGALQLMQAELQVLSPLATVREVNFLRFCKQHAEGVWAVVDVSVDTDRENSSGSPLAFRRLPSGCVVQDLPNGYSKVTWVEHAEYDETQVHHLLRPLLSSGFGFGAQRWLAMLQRQCECLAILMSSTCDNSSAITANGRKSMVKLAQRMTENFCAGVSASSLHTWNKLTVGHVDQDVRVMTRRSDDNPGEPPGIVLSAATSVWLPASPQRLFDFLRDERLRCEWDILSNGGPMQEMAHIAKGRDRGNCVSLLRANAMNASQSSMLILQETCIDASGALVVYAPVDTPAMHVVMNGGDSSYVALLPSGFAILPDGSGGGVSADNPDSGGCPRQPAGGGSLLTVAFQILVNSLPSAKLTVESVETVNNLISCTVQKIKAALQCDN